MTRIESKKVIVPRPGTEVYNYLINLNNIQHLLPSEKITNFEAKEKSFSFKITGAITVELEVVETRPYDLIQFSTTGANSFQFTLAVHITDKGGQSEVQQICDADVNPFMKMMIEKPLGNLFDYMVDRLVKVMG